MPTSNPLLHTFRELAADTPGIDVEVYERFGKDPLEAVIGHGSANARIAFFGRDPGRDEVQHGLPFIGSGGQLVRRAIHQHLYGKPLPDFEASVALGQHFYWANTVPYKPVGNKAWSTRIKQRFQPGVSRLLLTQWHGDRIIVLGREAFLWFGLLQSREARQRVDAFWLREDRFESSLAVTLSSDGLEREVHLYPLPHPSPLNATWYGRFPGLLKARLEQLDARPNNLALA